MTIKRTDPRFKLVIFVMCLLLMITSIMPMFSRLNYVGAASNEITIYFDTSSTGTLTGCTDSGHGSHDWSTSMTPYYYAYSSSGNTGIQPMTAVNKAGTSGGKLFSAKVDKGTYSYIIFLSGNSWNHSGTDYLWQTNNYALSGVADNSIFILSKNGYNDGDNKKQGVGVRAIYSAAENYKGQTFSLLNMTSDEVTLKYRFTDETKDIANKTFNNDGTIVSATTTVNLGARNYYYNMAEVLDSNDSNKPYSTVEILDSSDTVIKKYFFEEGKILGKTFEYGVTQFSDNTVLSYQSSNPESVPAGNSIVYLEKGSFTSAGATVKGVYTTGISKSGNASYQTTDVVTTDAFTAPTTAGTYNLSDSLFTVEYSGNKYNLFWSENSSDNLISINDNVAVLSGVYTVQSTNNTLTEGTETYTYITTQADMFDYQYDHTSSSDPSYTYAYDNTSKAFYKGHILYTDSKGFETVHAYFYVNGTAVGTEWPGDFMQYVGRNSDNQKQFIIKIPDGASNGMVVFNNGKSGYENQTQDIAVQEDKGYYAKDTKNDKGYYEVGTWNLAGTSSEQGNAKRPYLTINEAISSSDYAKTKSNYPLYLGQFWLPIMDEDTSHDVSAELYNTNTTEQRAAHNSDGEYYFSDGRNNLDYSKYFGFGEKLANFDWSANLAYRYEKQKPGTYEPYNGVVQKLVYDKLNDDGKLMAKDNKNTIPYFDPDWWSGEFTNSQGDTQNMSDYLVQYNNLDFPFFATNYDKIEFKNYEHNGKLISNTSKKYDGTYYVFNSEKNVVKVNDKGTGLEKHYNVASTKVWDNYGEGTDSNGSEIGFFPFNGPDDGGHDSTDLHYGFGVKFSIDFYFNDYGTLDGTENGIPITFTFQGDDDVWVFLDDKLALDMGGGHKNSIGEINFADKTVFIGSAGTAGDSIAVNGAKPSKTQTFGELGLTSEYTKKGKHKITMFYLERGMLNSNLYVMFNLPVTLTKWELNEDTDFGNVNAGFASAAKYVADQDVFNYAVENKDTTNPIDSGYTVPTSANVIRENDESGHNRTTTLATITSQTGQSNKFVGSASGAYTPLVSSTGGVSYMVTDPFASGTVNYNTRTVNETRGVISLQYGEIATLSKQFNYGSGMRVTQLDVLSSPNGNGSYTDDISDSGRKVSKYYTTYMKSTSADPPLVGRPYAGIYNGDDLKTSDAGHANDLYNTLTNYSSNSVVNLQADGNTATYNFSDPTNGANEYVFLRQVVINEVKTANLKISKDFLTSETNDTSFEFTINFSNVFGSADGDEYIDYSKIVYTKYPAVGDPAAGDLTSKKFSLAAGDYIMIEGIPIGTKFYITETTTSETYELASDYSINMGTAANPVEVEDDVISMVYNNRKTGSFDILKQVYSENGTDLVSADDTKFDADITLTAPVGVDLSKYDIRVNGENITFISGTTAFTTKIKHNENVHVTGLPYGTVYSITEQTPPMGYIKLTEDNVTYTNDQTEIGSDVGQVKVSNKINPIIMPSTGGTPIIFLFPFGIIALAGSAAALVIYKKKLQGEKLIYSKRGRSE